MSEDGVCYKFVSCDVERSEVHEIFMRTDMKHSYSSNYFIVCLPSLFLLLKLIELLLNIIHVYAYFVRYIMTNLSLYMYLFIEIF